MSEQKPKRGRPLKKVEEVIEEQCIPQEQDTITISLEEAIEQGYLEGLIPTPQIARHTIFFDNVINLENVQGLINTLSEYPSVDLFFSTDGGEVPSMEVLLQYLNKRKDSIKIILTMGVASAGTFILTDFEGEVEVADNLLYLMIHKVDFPSYRNRREGELTKNLQKDVEKMNKKLSKKYKKVGFSSKHLEAFKKGKDVFIYRKEFKHLKFGLFTDE